MLTIWVNTGYIDVDWLYNSFFITQNVSHLILSIVRMIVLRNSSDGRGGYKAHLVYDTGKSIWGVINLLLMIFAFKSW